MDDEVILQLAIVNAAGGPPVRKTNLGCLVTTDITVFCSYDDDRAIRRAMAAETAWLCGNGFAAPGRMPAGMRVETVEGEGIAIFNGNMKQAKAWPAERQPPETGSWVVDAALSPDGKWLAVWEFHSRLEVQLVVGLCPDLHGPPPLTPPVDNDPGPPGPAITRPAQAGALKPGPVGWSQDSRMVAYLLHGQEGAGSKELLFAVHDVARDTPLKVLSVGWQKGSKPLDPNQTRAALESVNDWLRRQGFVPAPPLPPGVRFVDGEARFELHVAGRPVVEYWPPDADLNMVHWRSAATVSPNGRLLAFVGECEFNPSDPQKNTFAARAPNPGAERLVVGVMP